MPLFVLSVTVAVLVMIKLVSYTNERISEVYEKIKDKAFYSWFIRIFVEMYIMIILACLIKIYAIDFTNAFESLSSIFGITLLLSTIALAISATVFLW